MRTFMVALATLAAFAAVVPADAAGKKASPEAIALMNKAIDGIDGLMALTYACRDELGGDAQYQAARLSAELFQQRLGSSRDEAVLLIAKTEAVIKRQATPEAFAARGLDLNNCPDVVTEARHNVDIAVATFDEFVKSH